MLNPSSLLVASMFMIFPGFIAAQGLTDWEGVWRGPCQNLRPSATSSNQVDFTMERTVSPINGTNRYLWRSSYQQGASVKDYELVEVDPSRGHYQIDEGGGVLIDSYLAGNTLYAHFQTGPVQITTIERIEGYTLIFELLSFESKAEDSPVSSFRFQMNQRCVLTRI